MSGKASSMPVKPAWWRTSSLRGRVWDLDVPIEQVAYDRGTWFVSVGILF